MTKMFNKLNSDKQKKIINAALNEFVQHGYEKSSTIAIARDAHIAKGSLFNYFGDKKGLFEYLLDYSVNIINQLYDQIDLSETDLFKRLENIGLQKMNIQKEHPQIYDFLKAVGQEKSSKVKMIIDKKFSDVKETGLNKIYSGIDFSKFKDDIELEKAMEILNWTMFGFSERVLGEIDTFNNIDQFGEYYVKEWNKYAEYLKTLFYKRY
jgi:hypothetical protein